MSWCTVKLLAEELKDRGSTPDTGVAGGAQLLACAIEAPSGACPPCQETGVYVSVNKGSALSRTSNNKALCIRRFIIDPILSGPFRGGAIYFD